MKKDENQSKKTLVLYGMFLVFFIISAFFLYDRTIQKNNFEIYELEEGSPEAV